MIDKIKSYYKKIRVILVKRKNKIMKRRRFLVEVYYGAQNPGNGFLKRGAFFLGGLFLCLLGLNDNSAAWERELAKWRNKPYHTKPESTGNVVKSYTQFCKTMLQYDVISFDVFDTLILRPFDNPTSVFFLLDQKHKCPSFHKYRIQAEKDARADAYKKNGNYEVTIEDIYEMLNRYILLDTKQAIRLEIETELELAFANPYMKNVFLQAKNLNKKIIAVSDMYLSSKVISQILEKCGYFGIVEVFVSNEAGVSKREGGIFNIVRDKIGKDLKYFHIGDNYKSDFLSPREQNWDAEYYKNVNHKGKGNRACDLTELVGSAYRGIVNAHIRNGASVFDQYYEYGYTYSGFFALGYCHFIHDYVQKNHVDKVLFLSRDGYLLKRVYNFLYPDDNTEYVFWSRTAAIQTTLKRSNNEFFLRYMKYKIPHKLTLAEIFKAMELEHFCDFLEGELKPETILTKNNYNDVVTFFRTRWEDVITAFSHKNMAAKLYYSKVVQGCKKACAIDIGWAASGYNAMRYLIEDEWKLDCKLTGLVAGSKNMYDKDVIEAQLIDGSIDSYLFSQRLNPDIYKKHQVNKLYSVFMEIMLSAPFPSFKGFLPDEQNGYKLSFDLPEVEGYEMMRKIEDGAMDFVHQYTSAFKNYPYMTNIPGCDVYEVCRHVISRPEYFRNMFGDYPVQRAVGHSRVEMMTISQLMDREFKN